MEDAVWHQEQAGGGGGRVQVGREVGGPEVDHEVAWKELAGDEALSPWRRGHAVRWISMSLGSRSPLLPAQIRFVVPVVDEESPMPGSSVRVSGVRRMEKEDG